MKSKLFAVLLLFSVLFVSCSGGNIFEVSGSSDLGALAEGGEGDDPDTDNPQIKPTGNGTAIIIKWK